MVNIQTLIDVIVASRAAFSAEDRAQLNKLFNTLSEILADCDGFGFDVIDSLWQACRGLQQVLDADEIDSERLVSVQKQLQGIVALASEKDDTGQGDDGSDDSGDGSYKIPEDDLEIIEDFVIEGTEHLEVAEAALLDLEADVENRDVLNRLFRSFHTIKGMAGFMNLTQIGQVTHDAETLLDLARKGSLILTDSNADAVYKTIDMLKAMVETLRDALGKDGVVPVHDGVDELCELLQECAVGGERATVESAVEADSGDESGDEEPGEMDESESSGEERSVEEESGAETESDETPAEQATAAGNPSGATSKPAAASGAPARKSESKAPATDSKTHAAVEDTIKVKTSRLDSLINMIGELVIAQLMVAESYKVSGAASGEKLEQDIVLQSKLIRELQELSTSMRMVPIKGIFQKMARMTRDLSRKAGKNIQFLMHGEQTELDRTIVDKLSDPLVHMIRNSVDHGIDDPETRKAAGKSAEGHITLRAFHASGNIVIEIEDDGRGLNREKLFDKGVSMGLFRPDSTPPDTDIFNVIFTPGLSTAEQITSVSGRGVGMDVVRRNIENLRGRIDIASTPGQGTRFIITLPLTLAIIDGQIVRVGDEQFIIPINVIRKSFRPERGELSTVQGRGEMVSDRGDLLRLVRLHRLFDVEPLFEKPEDGLVVVVEQDNCACGLFVDDLLDQQQVVIKNLGGILGNTPGVAGGAIMGNGRVSLILDIPGIIKLSRD